MITRYNYVQQLNDYSVFGPKYPIYPNTQYTRIPESPKVSRIFQINAVANFSFPKSIWDS